MKHARRLRQIFLRLLRVGRSLTRHQLDESEELREALDPRLELGPLLRLVVEGFAHAAEDPEDPSSVGDFRDEAEGEGGLRVRFLLASGNEVIHEPLGDEEEAEVVLLRDFGAFGLDVLQEAREESCEDDG